MRHCSRCGEDKPLTDFYRAGQNNAGEPRYMWRCKVCLLVDRRKRYAADPEMRARIIRASNMWPESSSTRPAPMSARQRHLRSYGLTEADFGAILMRQGGRCAICEADAPGGKHGTWMIDHCHTSGVVRGLLCLSCNTGVGQFKDSPETLRAAADYLERTSALA